jgi:hypothetical protein
MYIIEGLEKSQDGYTTFHLIENESDGHTLLGPTISVEYIAKDGFISDALTDPESGNVTFARYVGGEIMEGGFENDVAAVLELISKYNLTHYAYCLELLWDNDGRPSLRPDSHHVVLGTVTPGDRGQLDFEPFVTLLPFKYYEE